MVYKPDEEETIEIVPERTANSQLIHDNLSSSNEKENSQKAPKKQSTEDLFNAHNFDITIDLEVPIPSKYLLISILKIVIDDCKQN